ncbi:MAG: 4-alpha-glucanotransferase [Deltaproteobacteria bacterium]|nr:MAG: 4-alpha-glucanotransferase [Deltaproteobacteria bacterium]
MPSPLREHAGGADWATAAAGLRAVWVLDSAPPSPGELAAATALQAALTAQIDASPLSLEAAVATLDAALAANPATPWLAEALGECPPPDVAFVARHGDHALFDALIAPFLAADDLHGQLAWVLDHWEVPAEVRDAGVFAWDVLAEESTFRGGGPGPTEAPGLGELVGDPGYSDDAPWMTAAVLQVKHGPVWMAQLSAWTGQPVRKLDHIPESELRRLASHGATVLWLVGIWERSPASERIKRIRGAKEAIASAYSLVDYRVARHLGGEPALEVLKVRAARAGLRLCADVVPNHTGLDSTWMVEHPEWFVQTEVPPFPSYRFSGPNLSGDPRIEVRIEDGYWRADDAAVVFERRDVATGKRRYVYHGNDGTTMPWNDTAQLDVSLPEVRQALIDTVLRLTARFSALRFDAAMALARQHVKRLWYPDPGEGGAIPSRSGKSLSDEEWMRRMPGEFWSELVQAVREQAPGTLLLAEAFWLMEVDFARAYGLHRVYWSAFRDWIRDGRHAEHKSWLEDALAKEPELLGRLCLFLSNPDEKSAATAFGTGARYLAAATLQVTLPGLPLLAHGQVDGLPEQYGMEFSRPHLIDPPDERMEALHEARLLPLLARRALFGAVDGFRLYRFLSGPHAQDCVYAYTQKRGEHRALIVVNSSPEPRRGRLHTSVPMRRGGAVRTADLAEGLALGPSRVTALHDAHADTWTLHLTEDLRTRGLALDLAPWQTIAVLDVIELADEDGRWTEATRRLGGKALRRLEDAFADDGLPRAAGVLLHPSSLPGRERIGTLGKQAHAMAEWLASAGFSWWQVLPLCPGGPGDSPYSSPTSRLGDPLLLDLATLKHEGWLKRSELRQGRAKKRKSRIRFDKVRKTKRPLLDRAAKRLLAKVEHPDHQDFLAWKRAHAWADEHALFDVLRSAYGGRPWWEWEEAGPSAELVAAHREAIDVRLVLAFWFDRQWAALRVHAEKLGLSLISDLPIYVALDSAEVWSTPEIFELDEQRRPQRLSAVPPDAFAEDGQIWGNPLYRWELPATRTWWIERFARAREWTPVLRIDHFRGFADYYAVDAAQRNAREGVWNRGPGVALFEAIDEALGSELAIAEDLGQIDARVHELREATGMLGTRVLQFGLGPSEADNPHQPSALTEDAAVYTGTHDNDTTVGWWTGLDPAMQAAVARQLGVEPTRKAALSGVIDEALRSPCALAIFPMQDLLGLGRSGRMNLPGSVGGNWSWRMKRAPSEDLAEAWADRLARFER